MLFFMVTGEDAPARRVQQLKIDETLFTRIGQGDMDALETFYTLTERSVYAFTLSLLKNPEDTQDVVQETYLKVRAAAHLYEPRGKPLAWLFTIARNLSRNLLRQRARTADPEETDLENDERFSYISDRTDRIILEAALRILGEDERQILLLHAVSGVRHHEIAQSLGVPLSTALSRYHRALKKLKRYFLEQGVAF